MTMVFVETDPAGEVTLTSAEALTFARKNPQLLPDGGAATSREVSGPPSGSSWRAKVMASAEVRVTSPAGSVST